MNPGNLLQLFRDQQKNLIDRKIPVTLLLHLKSSNYLTTFIEYLTIENADALHLYTDEKMKSLVQLQPNAFDDDHLTIVLQQEDLEIDNYIFFDTTTYQRVKTYLQDFIVIPTLGATRSPRRSQYPSLAQVGVPLTSSYNTPNTVSYGLPESQNASLSQAYSNPNTVSPVPFSQKYSTPKSTRISPTYLIPEKRNYTVPRSISTNQSGSGNENIVLPENENYVTTNERPSVLNPVSIPLAV